MVLINNSTILAEKKLVANNNNNNNNNNASVFILRRLHPDDNERVMTTLWTEAHCIWRWRAESAVGSTRVTSATLHLHVQAATIYTRHHRPGIITPELLPVPIYRPRKDG